MNSLVTFSTSPIQMIRSFLINRQLIAQMTKREVVGRYRDSVLGIFWSFFNPVFMLAVYTFVFSVVFKARWGGGSGSKTEFALMGGGRLHLLTMSSSRLVICPSAIRFMTSRMID